MVNVCTVGYGMMGVWHSDALARTNAVLHTLVGRRPEAAEAFAQRYGYRRWTASLDEALADPEIDAIILATPSEAHEGQAIRCLKAGKPTLVEIPVAMSLAGAERVVAAAELSSIPLGVCHPMRFRPERHALQARVAAGDERIRHIAGRFFIKRLENVGATGYRRTWTDNLLWHHFCHFVDSGVDLLGGVPIRRVQSFMGACHPQTGIPMECVVLIENDADQSALVHGSYHASYRLYDELIVTDRDTYAFDNIANTLRTTDGLAPLEEEAANCARVTLDFVEAVRVRRPPRVTGASVLPAMRVLQAVQDDWDARHGPTELPGRPLP